MISVIIPTKNRPLELLACLQGLSVQNSLHMLSEIVVVDDHSHTSYEDQVRRFAKEKELPVIFLGGLKETGTAAARNGGATKSIGRILAFLDDDAVPTPTWLQIIARSFNNRKNMAITGRILPLDADCVLSRARQLRYESRQRTALKHGGQVQFMAGGNSAVLREHFVRCNGFNNHFHMMHDQDLALRLSKISVPCCYAHDLVIHHLHSKGWSVAIQNAFRSGYYRSELERLHCHVRPWSIINQLQSYICLFNLGILEFGQILATFTAMSTETVHSCGYLYYRSGAMLKKAKRQY